MTSRIDILKDYAHTLSLKRKSALTDKDGNDKPFVGFSNKEQHSCLKQLGLPVHCCKDLLA